MRIILLCSIPILLCLSCKQSKKVDYNHLKSKRHFDFSFSNFSKDTCLIVQETSNSLDSLLFYRAYEVLENTLTDTISIGYGVLHPNWKGFFISIQGDAKGSFVGLDPDVVDWAISKGKPAAFTKFLCISQYNRLGGKDSVIHGKLRIRVYLKE